MLKPIGLAMADVAARAKPQFNWKAISDVIGRVADRENERRCDQYNSGWLAGYGGKPITDDPDFAAGWREGQHERRNPVVVVMPERPEGYYHAPIGTFD